MQTYVIGPPCYPLNSLFMSTLSDSHNNHIALWSSLLIQAFSNSLSDLNWPVMASHSWSGDPTKEWMIGLTTESHTIYWIQPFSNSLSDLNLPVMASHSWSGDPTTECMIGLQTEWAVATVTEDSIEEKAVARARVDVVTDSMMSIPKLGYWIAGGSIGHLKTRNGSRKGLVMIPTKACITNSSSAFCAWHPH